jgi:hypothetical protein
MKILCLDGPLTGETITTDRNHRRGAIIRTGNYPHEWFDYRITRVVRTQYGAIAGARIVACVAGGLVQVGDTITVAGDEGTKEAK